MRAGECWCGGRSARRCASQGPRIHVARGVTDHEQEPRAEGLASRRTCRVGQAGAARGRLCQENRPPCRDPLKPTSERAGTCPFTVIFTADDPLEAVCSDRTVPARLPGYTAAPNADAGIRLQCPSALRLRVCKFCSLSVGPRSTSGSGVACASLDRSVSHGTPRTALPVHMPGWLCRYTSAARCLYHYAYWGHPAEAGWESYMMRDGKKVESEETKSGVTCNCFKTASHQVIVPHVDA